MCAFGAVPTPSYALVFMESFLPSQACFVFLRFQLTLLALALLVRAGRRPAGTDPDREAIAVPLSLLASATGAK